MEPLLKICCLVCFILAQLPFGGNAQDFDIPIPRRTNDEFTINYVTVLNQAPYKFIQLKGRQIFGTDSLHKGSQIFLSKIKLPGCSQARMVKDSTLYMEYFYGDYKSYEEAAINFERLLQKIKKALNRKAFVKDYGADTASSLVHVAKVAYVLHSGFFHFNTALQIIKPAEGKWRILFQIYYGKPQFYYKIFYEPIASFVLVNALHSNLEALQDNQDKGCPTDLLTFECMGKTYKNDTLVTRYIKNGFEDLANATTEYDALLTNVRAALGTQYVYYYLPVKPPYTLKMAFINLKDIEQTKRKTIIIGLLQDKNNNAASPSYVRTYAIDIAFMY